MGRWEKRDQDLYMKAGDNHMKINIGNLEFTELQDGVLYKALSDYPNVSDTEMKDSIDFVNYEKSMEDNVNQINGDDENSMYSIMIIDDESIGNMEQELLEREGYLVQRAYLGTEALLLKALVQR